MLMAVCTKHIEECTSITSKLELLKLTCITSSISSIMRCSHLCT
ncbi:hypothetical protein Ccrd_025327 [Cynara cardunculus var. scolymus]|uniref:Uncharacterized protein n=1 Tax=Cynara cardunculus var. scolymus TaxID=59895 RepID=A0A103XB19_CYNCS|nr:hypothetical protein Ccrd_025327 [Cynara cardunculus var. scolymus]